MRSANWTPSIVPSSDDRDVCLVVDDFGRRGAPTAKPMSRPRTLRPSSTTYSTGSIRTPCASSASTPRKAGRGIFLPISQTNCADGAICGYGLLELEVKGHRCETEASIPWMRSGGPKRQSGNWKLKCRSCRKGRCAPPVHLVRLTEEREITPYAWVHPDQER